MNSLSDAEVVGAVMRDAAFNPLVTLAQQRRASSLRVPLMRTVLFAPLTRDLGRRGLEVIAWVDDNNPFASVLRDRVLRTGEGAPIAGTITPHQLASLTPWTLGFEGSARQVRDTEDIAAILARLGETSGLSELHKEQLEQYRDPADERRGVYAAIVGRYTLNETPFGGPVNLVMPHKR